MTSPCMPCPVLSEYIQNWSVEYDILYKVICASEEEKKNNRTPSLGVLRVKKIGKGRIHLQQQSKNEQD